MQFRLPDASYVIFALQAKRLET